MKAQNGRLLSYVAAASGLLLLLSAGPRAFAQSSVTVVMSGLDNPRGLAFGPDGALYVAEAGKGGDLPALFERGQQQFIGATGAVSRLIRGRQERIVFGFSSVAPAGGAGAA